MRMCLDNVACAVVAVATVQEPGSMPPEDVPDLMTVLRVAAEEQLVLVQKAHDHDALHSALEFGKWIKVPTKMLVVARNTFKGNQFERDKALREYERRVEMGLAPKVIDLSGDTSPPHSPAPHSSGNGASTSADQQNGAFTKGSGKKAAARQGASSPRQSQSPRGGKPAKDGVRTRAQTKAREAAPSSELSSRGAANGPPSQRCSSQAPSARSSKASPRSNAAEPRASPRLSSARGGKATTTGRQLRSAARLETVAE